MVSFRVTHKDNKSHARTGIIKTAHGVIHTPALFISHLDGSAHFFPPEKLIDVQMALGADLIVALSILNRNVLFFIWFTNTNTVVSTDEPATGSFIQLKNKWLKTKQIL